jgi:biopolymer transport protein ExbD
VAAIRFDVEMPKPPRKFLWLVCLTITAALCIYVLTVINEVGKLEIEAVTLPESVASKIEIRRYDVTVNVMRDGTYRIRGTTLSAAEVDTLLTRTCQRTRGRPRAPLVKIRCDADAPYEYVQHVLEFCRSAGIQEVSFGVAQAYVPVSTEEEDESCF